MLIIRTLCAIYTTEFLLGGRHYRVIRTNRATL